MSYLSLALQSVRVQSTKDIHLISCLVAQDSDGNVFHGRNADFGLMGGLNRDTLTWALTESMKHNVIDVTFTRDGGDLYKVSSSHT